MIYQIGDEYLLAFWFAISAYIGSDQVAAVVKTKGLPAGQRFTGNREKLGLMTAAVFILTAEALVLQLLTGIDLPVVQLATTFICCVGLLAGGEKAKTAMENQHVRE